ncbi:MAG: SRPBCC family protein [Aggregatilineales bacterium]
MPLIETTLTIQKPLFDVFKEAGTFENWQKWQPKVSRVTVVSGSPVRAGTMVSMAHGGAFINADVLVYQRNKEIQLKGMWGRFYFTRNIVFQTLGGSTTITDTLNIKTGMLFFWYAPFLQMSLNKDMKNAWGTLKKQLEG